MVSCLRPALRSKGAGRERGIRAGVFQGECVAPFLVSPFAVDLVAVPVAGGEHRRLIQRASALPAAADYRHGLCYARDHRAVRTPGAHRRPGCGRTQGIRSVPGAC